MKPAGKTLASILFLVSLFLLGFQTEQYDFVEILSCYTLAFASFAFLMYHFKNAPSLRLGIALGIIARVIMIFAFPFHSDDIYRFYWDGSLVLSGYNPFTFLPSEVLELDVSGLNQELFNLLNSQEYYSVYPFVCQAIFTSARWLSGESLILFSLIVKFIFLLGELITVFFGIKLLKLLAKKTYLILLYFLNPLMIVELVGNLHFEAIMIAFVAPGLFYLVKGRTIKSAVFFAIAIATKIVPALLVVVVFRKLKIMEYLKFASVAVIVSILLFLPVFWGHLDQFSSSLDLYFRSFEFNASLYYVARQIAYVFYDWNMIAVVGPSLALLTILIVGVKVLKTRSITWEDFFGFALLLWCVYLSLSTTVHPWYLAMPVFLSIFTRFRFVVIWSLVVVLSYSHYSAGNYSENYYLITLEYLLVFGFFLYELFVHRDNKELVPLPQS